MQTESNIFTIQQTVLTPHEDDPHPLSLQASDLPEDSFESDDSNPTTSTVAVTTADNGE